METKGDFASLLDDLFQAADVSEGPPAVPAVDYLAVVEELHSGRIRVSPEAALAGYRETEDDELQAELAELIAERECADVLEALPPVSEDAVARELELGGRDRAGLAQARRLFALRNHPDRVALHLREHALRRMQIANMLIDAAEREMDKARH